MITRGEWCNSRGHPHPQLEGPRAPQFWGLPSISAYTVCCRTTKFDVVTHGEGLVLGDQPRPYSRGWGPSATHCCDMHIVTFPYILIYNIYSYIAQTPCSLLSLDLIAFVQSSSSVINDPR